MFDDIGQWIAANWAGLLSATALIVTALATWRNSRTSRQQARADGAAKIITGFDAFCTQLQKSIEALTERVTALESERQGLLDKIAANEHDLAELRAALTAVQAENLELCERIKELEAENHQLRQRLAVLEPRNKRGGPVTP